jgi:hypothetical protein
MYVIATPCTTACGALFFGMPPESDKQPRYVSVNRGSSGDYGSAPAFEYLTPAYHENPLRGTRSQTHVRLGDIDGDGRLDYCLIHDNGDIECWRNGWIWDHARWWEHMGIVFTGKNKGNIDGVRFIDINGDVRFLVGVDISS